MAAIGWEELELGVVYSARDMADRYGAPLAQVRAALAALTHDGLVVPLQGRGYRLTEPTAEELRELIELRLLVEVATARKVAEIGVTDRQIAHLTRLARDTARPARETDLIGYIRADLEFHLDLMSLGGNDQVVEVVRLLRARSRIPGLRPVAKEFMVRNAQEHSDMVVMLADGDSVRLEELLRHHIQRVLDS